MSARLSTPVDGTAVRRGREVVPVPPTEPTSRRGVERRSVDADASPTDLTPRDTTVQITRSSLDTVEGPADRFTGDVHIDAVAAADPQ